MIHLRLVNQPNCREDYGNSLYIASIYLLQIYYCQKCLDQVILVDVLILKPLQMPTDNQVTEAAAAS